ncbi:uncharacterized protein LOC107619756 isoform X1 [Arachis ipaensis]|uniref:Plant synaptotagmin n=1 Tax=Arachis hypogaea TaxID=3818 RepID=A0A444XK52_ARAHY|nr:uncharacterized protein LOC107619756 isoform X1 [Arachis ipaensis]XP_025679483.1 uncharacterized protein LOC112779435 isoform X1 [Arachis hypogaea]QHN77291.1 Plant synaptotagmin [Arachis hypogaea]RYQ90053.1 hypothetical protein Ahy_B09g096351 [Arachis hypogaea]
MTGNAMEERKRRCSVAAETPPPLLGLVSVTVLPPSGFCAPAEELERRKEESVELQEFSLGSCPPSVGLQGMRWSTIVDQEKLFVRAIQELWQWWSRLLRVVVDTEEEEAVVMVLATAAVVVEAVTTVGILGFCKGLPNKLSLKNCSLVGLRGRRRL